MKSFIGRLFPACNKCSARITKSAQGVGRRVPCSDGLPGGVGGVFCSIGFYITGGSMRIKRKFAHFFHPKRSLAFSPLPDCIDGFARTLVIWPFFFKIFKHSPGFIRRFKSK